MRVSAQLYTLRDHLKTPDQMSASFERLAGIGYRLVQVAGVGPVEPARLRRMLNDAGLEPHGSHVAWNSLQQNLEAAVAEQEALGCRYTAVSSIPESYRSREGYLAFARELTEAARQTCARDIRLAYHNHSFEFTRYGDCTGMELLVAETDPELVAFEIDTYWIQHGGGDPARWICRVAGRAPVIHVKDLAMDGTTQLFAEVGEGNLHWPSILEACRDAGVEYLVVEQDRCQGDPFVSLEKSLNNLLSWGLST